MRIVQGVVTLLEHPDQLADLKKDPGLVKNTVDELLRYHTASALALRRVATADVEIAGKVGTKRVLRLMVWSLIPESADHQGRRGCHTVQPVGES